MWRAAGLAVLGTLFLGLATVFGTGAETPTDKKAEQKPEKKAEEKLEKKPAKQAEKKPETKRLTGAELYSMHCNRCHPERYPTERTAAQWKTILLHMRVRANLPAEQSRTILKYLQDNSGR
jgi:hypothetical protein